MNMEVVTTVLAVVATLVVGILLVVAGLVTGSVTHDYIQMRLKFRQDEHDENMRYLRNQR